MSNVKLEFINKSALQLFLTGAALFLITPSAQSLQPSSRESKSENKLENIADAIQVGLPTSANSSTKKVIQVAQVFKDVCPPNTDVYRSGETRNYLVQICASENGNFTFVGVTKNNSSDKIVLSVPSNSGQQFVGVSGNNRYILNRRELRIIQNGKKFTEQVLQWYEKIQLKQ
ncbi:hypothetical protein Cri9333_3630 [Crinalium epipsammum PCC 9333]|uniref:Uncharacterized protein n=1 Tax=Crinalium epipsammum PCC 9333 TaxID=1173022 RepID=K9W268_9CYAN|nr:hypothetical protein [Crinalium epipsammum]AFZ14448.1 hypothetical protein Cri9333_3630 [Crinalium epipsammum PCC 9333]